MMKIDRTELVSQLAAFARDGNGVVIGAPGVGKSYALAEVRENFKRNKVLHLIMPVERLGTASDAELKYLLKRDGDFVELLRVAAANAKAPAILIFDGFDAARGEIERASVLRLILRAVNELRGQWNTIVSVRTFDAKKSQRLLELFRDTKATAGTATASCRQFLIPALQVPEVEQALVQIPGLRILHDSGTTAFRALLTVPFNLWLIERVLRAGAKANEFSKVTSEVQLLEMYWEYRVRRAAHSEDREFILKTAARAMVEAHTLTVRRDRIYQPQVREAWEGLLSDEIITEVPEREAAVAFTHNILFDFAVSVHLLESEPKRLADFVAEEPARPLFLRPSLVYHFTRLWHFNRNAFWQNFWAVVQREEMHLRQIVRLVLPAVVVSEAQTLEDLSPLLERLRTSQSPAIDAVALLLQALRILKSQKTSLWAEFLRSIGQHLDLRFAWDVGIIATEIIDSKEPLAEKAVSHCGELGRRLLGWAWASRKNEEQRHWFERLAGLVAIPLVAKTYATGADEARGLLKHVLDVVGERDFPIDCIYRLTHEVQHIIPHDPELVGLVYERVFAYEERSNQATNMGSGPVLPLISNRRQDYDMCRFSLIQEFPKFLADATTAALKAGIRAVQACALQDHMLPYLRDGKSLDDLTFEFQFRSATVHYVKDHSHIWDESSYPEQELQIADAIFDWLATAAKADRIADVNLFLDVFCNEARLAFLWSRLLAAGAGTPKILGPYLWQLAVAKPVVEGLDTLNALAAFLEQGFEFLSEKQRRQIEEIILKLCPTGNTERKETLEPYRDRLISCIPKRLLFTENAKQLRESLEKENKLRPNTPLFSSSFSWSPVTEEQMLKRQGATPESPANAELRELYRPLKEWGEKNNDETQIDGLMQTSCAVRDFLSKENRADAAVLSAASTHLSTFASKALLKTNDSTSQTFQTLRDMVLAAARHPEPEPYPDCDFKWNSATWSPAPRNEAAQALPWLTHFGKDQQALAAIQRLARDSVPSVRFLLACELWRVFEHMPDAMWTILDDVAETDKNRVVMQGITVSLWNLIHRDKDRSLALIQKLLKRVEVEEETDDEQSAQTALIYMIVDYAVLNDDQWAKETIARWQESTLKYSTSVSTAGRRLIEYITPQPSGGPLARARSLLLNHLNAVAIGLCSLQKKDANIPQEELQKKSKLLYMVIHEAIMRIYFAADVNADLRQRKEHPLSDEQRVKFFQDALPVLERVLSFGRQPDTGKLLAPTAHHFMELLNGILRYDPRLALRMATEVVSCSKPFGYNLDSMAMRETVKLVESILADHRESVQEEASIKNLLKLLDAFVEAGWPEALNLVWRLDEIYR
jgi:hypothetical protein